MMRSALLALLCTAAAVHASPARAQSCDTSGGNGGSDSGTSSSGDAGDGGSFSDVEVCRDDTEITGLEQCTRFGAGWDASNTPRLSIRSALGARFIPFGGFHLEGTSTHDENPYRWSLDDGDLGASGTTAIAFELGASFFLGDHVFTGLHLGLGGGSLPGAPVDTGDVVLDPRSAVFFEGATGLGLSLPLGSFAVRAEARAGVRGVLWSFESTHGACVTTTSSWTGAFFLEPRLSVDWFVTPWVSLGAFAGADVLDRLAPHGGLSLVLHARSFDGQ